MFVSNMKRCKAFATDLTLSTLSAYYSDGERRSGTLSLSSGYKYCSYADWNYTSAEGANANGYSRKC